MNSLIINDEDFEPLKGAVVVVTGGSSGIGLATVRLLLAQGANVVVGDRQEPPPDIVGDNLIFLRTDVTSWIDLKGLFGTAESRFGRVDHAFANAGIEGRENCCGDDLDEDGELKEPNNLVIQINLIGIINTTNLAVHHIKKHGNGGSVVMTASTAAFQRFSAVDYTTAKHGVLGLMRGLAGHLYPKIPIRINSIAPSWTATNLVPIDLCKAAGVPVQSAEAVARSVVYLMANPRCNQQLMYSVSGIYTEIESDLIKAADEIRPKELSEDDDLKALMAFAAKSAASQAPTGDT